MSCKAVKSNPEQQLDCLDHEDCALPSRDWGLGTGERQNLMKGASGVAQLQLHISQSLNGGIQTPSESYHPTKNSRSTSNIHNQVCG